MTIKDIERVLNLLNTNQPEKALKELTDLRQAEILKQTNKKGAKLFDVTKAYLKRHEEDRPILSKLQPLSDGKKFVVDGYTAIKFMQDRPELNTFPVASESNCISGEQLFESRYFNFDKISDNDMLILRNIQKYLKLYKHNVDNHTLIYLFDRYIECQLIIDVMKFINTSDYEYITVKPSAGLYSAIHLVSMDTNCQPLMYGLILPIRVNGVESQERIKADTNEFIELLNRS